MSAPSIPNPPDGFELFGKGPLPIPDLIPGYDIVRLVDTPDGPQWTSKNGPPFTGSGDGVYALRIGSTTHEKNMAGLLLPDGKPRKSLAEAYTELEARARLARAEIARIKEFAIPPADETALTRQVGGDHYKDHKIQPVEFIHANKLNFLEGCVIKRVCRHRAKNGRQDLEKAIHELQLLIELEYSEP